MNLLTINRNNLPVNIFTSMFIFLLIAGVLSKTEYNFLPATTILEIVFLTCAFLMLRIEFEKKFFIYFFAASVYFLFSFFYAVLINNVHVLDFLQAYKAFFYIPFLCWFVGSSFISLEKFLNFYKLSIFLFYIKYTYSRIFHFSDKLFERPGILDENNFELMFLILPLFILCKFSVKNINYYFFAVFALVVISGSRSALLALLACFYFCNFRTINIRTLLYVVLFFIISMLAYSVFQSRMNPGSSIEDIDRYKLFVFFLHEIENWDFHNYIFGAERLTRLSDATCLSLPYYDVLYSFRNDNSCYSVILHSYLMRVIFDHGFLGLVFLLSFFYSALVRAGFDRWLSSGFIIAILCSALSVSSFNSVYVSLSLALAVSMYKTNEN